MYNTLFLFAAHYRRQGQATSSIFNDLDEHQEQVITNTLSENPSRNHITTSSSKKRRRAERLNRNLSRDPRWNVHTAAKSARRPDPPTRPLRLSSKKTLSEQRQIFWPNNPVPMPRRHVCSKKKHIGKLSSLVYCSYPPNRPINSQEQAKKKELATDRPSNGDILSMMFHRPSSSAKKVPQTTDNPSAAAESLVSAVDTPTANRDDGQFIIDKPSTSLDVAHKEDGKGQKRMRDSVNENNSPKNQDETHNDVQNGIGKIQTDTMPQPASKRMRKSGRSHRSNKPSTSKAEINIHEDASNRRTDRPRASRTRETMQSRNTPSVQNDSLCSCRCIVRDRTAVALIRRKPRGSERDLDETQDLRRYTQIKMAAKRSQEIKKEEQEDSDEENPDREGDY